MTDINDTNWWVIVIATYAAIIATGALALEVRRWFEFGARLSIDVMPEAATFNMPGTEGNRYIVASVANRGNSATTITHFALLDYGTLLGRIRSKRTWSAVIPSPHPPGASSNIPMALQPGGVWTGMALLNDELRERIETGRLYIAIYSSHSNKPKLKRVFPAGQPPEDTEEMSS